MRDGGARLRRNSGLRRIPPTMLAAGAACGIAACHHGAPLRPTPAVLSMPVLDTTGPRPHVPDILRSAAFSSAARAHIELDSLGRIIPSRTRFLKLDSLARPPYHPLAEAMLRQALPTFRFTPNDARRSATPVALELEIQFLAPPDSVPAVPVFRQEPQSWGIRIVAGDEPVTRSPVPPKYSAATLKEIHRAVLAAMLPLEEAQSPPGRVTCVAIYVPDIRQTHKVDPDPDLLAGFDVPNLVPSSRCPQSYWRMFALIDSLGNPVDDRPPGYVDPASLLIERIDAWTADAALVYVRTSTGGAGRVVYCSIVRAAGGRRTWKATCRDHGGWVS